ncbi:MAG TPA: hypothetical protein VK539_28955 [Myxococcaceae bacterium]|nr:hypothetical protein [Myxococcaceae bacterium]
MAPEEEGVEQIGTTEQELNNSCYSTFTTYVTTCSTTYMYSSSSGSSVVATLGSNRSLSMSQSCPSNERFYMSYTYVDSNMQAQRRYGWIHRNCLAVEIY